MHAVFLLAALAPPAPLEAARPDVTLFVEMVVNGENHGSLVELQQRADGLWIDASVLRAADLEVAGDGALLLAGVTGLSAQFDASAQRLLLNADPKLLPRRRHIVQERRRARAESGLGAVLNYDLYVQQGAGTRSASLWSEQRLFGPVRMASSTGVFKTDASRVRYVRFDSFARYLDENRALALTVGDFIGNALPWTTAVRMGGIQIARSFRMRPDLVTMPLPSFAGQASVPSSVDLFINDHRQSRTDVKPGRYVLDNVPVVTGAGEARIVTRDAVGREIASTTPFYVTPELLRPGLVDFSVEVGALRQGYGLRSFDYGRAVAMGSVRAGLLPSLTFEGHGVVTPRLTTLGAGSVWTPGLWGSLHGSVMLSRTAGASGTQMTAGYAYASPHFGFAAEHRRRSPSFADLGSFDLAHLPGRERRTQVNASWAIDRIGSLGITYTAGRARDGFRLRVLTGSLSLPIGRQVSAYVAADHDFERGATSAQLRLVVPFGRAVVTGGAAYEPRRGASAQLSAARAIGPQGGFGFQASGAVAGNDRIGQGTVNWRGGLVEVELGGATRRGSTAFWGSAAGSLAFLDGAAFAANSLPDAFAVVSTGLPGVSVEYENQPVGKTDRHGRLFVPRVSPYHASRFAIDPLALPVDTVAERIETRVVLREGSGTVVRLPVRRYAGITLVLTDATGTPMPAGSIIRFEGGGTGIVGWDGVVHLEGAAGALSLTVETANGPCRADVRLPHAVLGPADLGQVRCA